MIGPNLEALVNRSHDPFYVTNRPFSTDPLVNLFFKVEETGLRVNPALKSYYRNPDVAYLMQNSHPKIVSGRKKSSVVPSLKLQSVHLNPESCRFVQF